MLYRDRGEYLVCYFYGGLFRLKVYEVLKHDRLLSCALRLVLSASLGWYLSRVYELFALFVDVHAK